MINRVTIHKLISVFEPTSPPLLCSSVCACVKKPVSVLLAQPKITRNANPLQRSCV